LNYCKTRFMNVIQDQLREFSSAQEILKRYTRGREPMAREPDVALLMTASGSLDIFLT